MVRYQIWWILGATQFPTKRKNMNNCCKNSGRPGGRGPKLHVAMTFTDMATWAVGFLRMENVFFQKLRGHCTCYRPLLKCVYMFLPPWHFDDDLPIPLFHWRHSEHFPLDLPMAKTLPGQKPSTHTAQRCTQCWWSQSHPNPYSCIKHHQTAIVTYCCKLLHTVTRIKKDRTMRVRKWD